MSLTKAKGGKLDKLWHNRHRRDLDPFAVAKVGRFAARADQPINLWLLRVVGAAHAARNPMNHVLGQVEGGNSLHCWVGLAFCLI